MRPHKNNSKYNHDEKPEEWRFISPIELPALPPFDFKRGTNKVTVAVGRTQAPTPDPEDTGDEAEDELEAENGLDNETDMDQQNQDDTETVTTQTTEEASSSQ